MKLLKNLLKIFLLLIVAGFLFIVFANYSIKKDSESFISYSVSDLPKVKTAVVLGTNKSLSNGNPNLYFKYRIGAATELYKSGKIESIIVSGDNSVKGYNEPEQMKLDLIANGIPADKIYEDFAGFRTLDSVVRAKEIFGQNKVIFISQKFHNERAAFLAQKFGIEAFGYNAKDVNKYAGLKTNLREYFAKAKAYLDIWFNVEPKFGGEKIEIK
ncbi:SanA/YdcF family protein [Epilithonimonas arachidiradicis]|uniref:Protein SanA n=1 Tax=Epilithonimonas arachidiradicis TaxID=1617282 RepID=A0A420DE56_9FLAO|nr:ElyC/SanA/YdcF family protein [Epilithonimonas arachidiradicis]RKE90066.1 SanA protein [Epilithonimonas arachidiradicis]GGG47447.1 protein SanA [Epilithonimonas arachidiradicis]